MPVAPSPTRATRVTGICCSFDQRLVAAGQMRDGSKHTSLSCFWEEAGPPAWCAEAWGGCSNAPQRANDSRGGARSSSLPAQMDAVPGCSARDSELCPRPPNRPQVGN